MTERRKLPKIEFVDPKRERVYWRESDGDIQTSAGSAPSPKGYIYIGYVEYENE